MYKEGILYYNFDNDRIGLINNQKWIIDGFHCGDVFEINKNGKWETVRIELTDDKQWYIDEHYIYGTDMVGIEARIKRY